MIILWVNIRVRSPPSWNSVFGAVWLRFSSRPRFQTRARNPVGPRPGNTQFAYLNLRRASLNSSGYLISWTHSNMRSVSTWSHYVCFRYDPKTYDITPVYPTQFTLPTGYPIDLKIHTVLRSNISYNNRNPALGVLWSWHQDHRTPSAGLRLLLLV